MTEQKGRLSQLVITLPEYYSNNHSHRIQRCCYAGTFYLKHNLHRIKEILLPPSRVSDLQVLNVQQHQITLNVTLEWMAPGGKLDNGRVRASVEQHSTREWHVCCPEARGEWKDDDDTIVPQSGNRDCPAWPT
ncbi:uncharacterized protein LOC143233984 isoform X2 [Tachypleus tridentatus]|uniref:uncharacterized protein LOC143233984 isoform X2 n=1 Tax=Tachypleus tridentatus TaxID=6853 RepID=UPI003FD2EB85